MTNLQAAVGVAQLEQIDSFIELRRTNARKYTDRLEKIVGIKTPVEKEWAKNVYWMYAIELSQDIGMNAEQMAQHLAEKDCYTAVLFRTT